MNLLERAVANQLELTGEEKKLSVSVSGQAKDAYSVYAIPLDSLYYNDQNGRITTLYKKYKAEFGELEPEVGNSEYNKIFESFIFDSNQQALKDTTQSIKEKSQQEPGVVLPDGRIIDGNRRFTALRMLHREDNIEKKFNAIILRLDAKTDEKKIKELELDLQLGREERVNYDPIDRIFDVYNTIVVEKIMTAEEYKKASGAGNTKGINRDIRLAELILKFINIVSPSEGSVEKQIDKFYLARDLKLDGPIEEIEGTINKMNSEHKEAATEAVLVHLAVLKSDNEQKDATRVMRKIKTHILKDSERLNHYVEAVDSKVDTIMDAFEECPINSANDIKVVFSKDEELKKSAATLKRSAELLVHRGENDSKRMKALAKLENILGTLEDMGHEDFDELTVDERLDAKTVIQEIKDVVFKLSKDLIE
ncbi:ParB N-terminal domain-containing protein [Enterococcus faecalis]|uniref:ParB/Srx family N-terminal domain-containing protein n=1 Tax=Enterococcus faecalis TaxID=1351 RepID=UPI0019DBF0AA|nr:ParB N-terminal domain-containing protein [Enterococcus faecalis]EGO7907814.1 ParB N-terminal domain-containing protein [Enterococcus faecalis]EGO9138085.1 chromosome partitioning protein ParB [Enterococcus faecalis]MDQ4499532.1 ParB N-terminal domain-containing protein [Enterococcus faecalis]